MASFDLQKAAENLRFNLDKAGVPPDVQAEMIFDLDVSGSFEHEHEEGTTGLLVERLMPWALVLDPDQAVDIFTFSHGEDNVHYVGVVTKEDYQDLVRRKIVGRVPGWKGGTTYSHALERNLQHFGWLPCDHVHGGVSKPETGGWFSRFLGLSAVEEEVAAAPHTHPKKRSIVIFGTDGECDPDGGFRDKARTRKILRESQERGDKVYFLFLGMCEHAEFDFVREIATEFSNVGIVMATDPEEFVVLSDDELTEKLLVLELIEWLKAA